MAIAPARTITAHLRKLSDAKLRATHAAANNPAQLAATAKEEGKSLADATKLLALINAEYARRFPTELDQIFGRITL